MLDALALLRKPGAWFYLVATSVYFVLRSGSFVDTPVRVTDTPTYETTVAAPLVSVDFVAGLRPFTVPLVWKLVGDDDGRIAVHLFVSIACWLTLAAAVAACTTSRALRWVAFALVLGFSATTEIILWDPLLLSESLSLSLTALLLAAWLQLVRAPSRAAAVALLATALLWTFTRDSHAYVLLVVGALAALTLVRPERRRLKAAVASGCVAIALASVASANHGGRWYQPMRDVLLNRIAPDDEKRVYFERRLGPFWREQDARRVYARYLLSHPGYTLGEPIFGSQNLPASSADSGTALLDPDLRIYNDNASDRALPLPRAVSDVLWVQGKRSILLVLLLVGAGAALVAWRAGFGPLWAVPVAALLTTIPHGLVAWHLSGLEVDRHALEVAVILRLAVLVLIVLALDAAVAALRVRARARASSPQPA